MASTSAISWGVGFFAAAAIQSRPRCDVYHVRPSTLHTHIKCHILQHFAKTQVSIGVYHIYSTHTHTHCTVLTSWCPLPVARPTVGACWGTSRHRTSPAALCLGASTGVVLLFPCPPLHSFPSPLVSCGFHSLQHQPTEIGIR